MTEPLIRSYVDSNAELVESFERYMVSRNLSKNTIKSYRHTIERFVEGFGSNSVVQARRADIHNFQARMIGKGQGAASLNAKLHALKLFFKFLAFMGLVNVSPVAYITDRKLPKRVRRVLAIKEIEQLIAAARDPFERAAVELFYASAMRVSELAALRLENIDFAGQTIRIKNGKGGKDRVALFGNHAAEAMREYIAWRKPKTFLFEPAPRNGFVKLRSERLKSPRWYGWLYVNGVQRNIAVGKLIDLPTEEDARKVFEKIASQIPGFHPVEGKPYNSRAFYVVLDRLSERAGIGHVHPHMFRRAAATHLLENGADIRYVQEFLGHARISTSCLYASLTTKKLFEIYERTHPHAQGNSFEK